MKTCFIDSGGFIVHRDRLAALEALGSVDVYDGMPETVDEVVRRAGEADVLAFALMTITNEMIDKLPKLKVIQFIGIGVSNFVDMDYAEAKGIKVLNIGAYGSNAVAEFGLALAMALIRNVTRGNQVVKSGSFAPDGLGGVEMSGLNVGILGTGSIGGLAARKYHALGAKVSANDIYENRQLKEDTGLVYKSMEEIFSTCDLISLHMTLNEESRGIISKEYFDLMKEGSFLVNVARAEIINREDLFNALASGKLRGAAIDVYDEEPPGPEDRKIIDMENVIATPHIGFYSEQANDNSIRMSVESILTHVKGVGGC